MFSSNSSTRRLNLEMSRGVPLSNSSHVPRHHDVRKEDCQMFSILYIDSPVSNNPSPTSDAEGAIQLYFIRCSQHSGSTTEEGQGTKTYPSSSQGYPLPEDEELSLQLERGPREVMQQSNQVILVLYILLFIYSCGCLFVFLHVLTLHRYFCIFM